MAELNTSSSSARLEMRGVSKSFGATVALDGVDLTVESSQVHALVGENGAGKSTLMKVLSGAIQPGAGTMRLDGRPYAPSNPLEGRKSGVAMIYQELSLAPHLSVEENILLGFEPARLGVLSRTRMRRLAQQALEQLEHPEIDPRVPVGRLSVGAQQIVEIARAVAIGCSVLVLDEPTSSLTRRDAERLFRLIDHLRNQDKAIIYISHFIEEVKQVSDKFTVLRDGRTVGGGLIEEATADDIVSLMVGRKVDDLYPHSERTPGEAVLEIDSLQAEPKPVSASLALHRGEVLGIAGLVGAGRTELLRTVFGLMPVKKGKIKVGAFIGPASPARRWAQSMGMLSEDRKDEGLAISMSIADNMTLSRLDGLGPGILVMPSRQASAASKWIDDLSIRCRNVWQPVQDLSGGNQQKVALARLLHHDVDVLLLDEPTRGIDVGSKAQIYKLIDQLATGAGGAAPRAVLMVSSYLPELMGICDRIAVMHRGILGQARRVENMDEHQLMLEATGQGEAA